MRPCLLTQRLLKRAAPSLSVWANARRPAVSSSLVKGLEHVTSRRTTSQCCRSSSHTGLSCVPPRDRCTVRRVDGLRKRCLFTVSARSATKGNDTTTKHTLSSKTLAGAAAANDSATAHADVEDGVAVNLFDSNDYDSLDFEDSTAVGGENRPLDAIYVSKAGDVSPHRLYTKEEVMKVFRIQKRDMRAIDPSFRNLPTVVCTDQLEMIEYVRCLISSEKCLLLRPLKPNAHEQLAGLKRRLSKRGAEHIADQGLYMPFEFLILDYVLRSVCQYLQVRLRALNSAFAPFLDVDDAYDMKRFTRMYGVVAQKHSLAQFEINVMEIGKALQELLEEDEDMARAYLTLKDTTGKSRPVEQHQELEELLENYLRQVEETKNEVIGLRKDIEIAEGMMRLELNSARNELMRADLVLQIGTLGVAAGALTAGMFGMNLTSHLEAHPYAFWIVSVLTVSSSCLFIMTAMRIARRRKLL